MAKPNPLSAVAAQVAESMGKAQDKPQPVALASYTPEPLRSRSSQNFARRQALPGLLR